MDENGATEPRHIDPENTPPGAVAAYGRWVVRWRWPVLIATLALAAIAISGVRFLALEGDYRYHFTADNPELVAFEHIENTYTKIDNILFVLVPASGEVFERDTLDAVRWLTGQGWQIPYAIRVDSLSNFQHTTATADDLVVADLVGRDTAMDVASLQNVRDIALAEPQLAGRLVARDAGATAVNVTIRLPDGGGDEGEPARYANELAEQLRDAHPGMQVAVTGSIPLIYAMMDTPQRDAAVLVPIMYLVLLVAMFVFLRSLWAVLGLLLMIGLAAASAMGAAGWLGIPLSPPMGSATTIILTIAVADGVHLLVILADHMRKGQDRRAAMVESLVVNWHPVLLTTITTVIGFLSLNSAGIPPFNDLGNVTAIGVAAAWVLAVTLLPAFVAIVPYRARPLRVAARFSADAFSGWLIRHHRRILPATVVFSLACAAFIPTIELDDSFIDYFDETVPFRADAELALKTLSGIYQLHYSLGAGSDGGVSDPRYLASVAAFAAWLREQPEVDHVNTLSDTMKRLNKNMHGDDEAAYALPASRELAAQYLLLYEMSLPYGLDLNNQVDVRKSATRVTATVDNLSAVELRALNARAMAWLAAHTEPAMHGSGASASFMLANLSRRSIDSMVRGTSVAFALIALILVLSLHSLRIGLLSLVPNILPIVIAYGIWALVVGKIGMVFAIVTASSLGIIVDATVHFMSKYVRARRVHGATAEAAVRYAVATVGGALLTTFLILAAGFAVLAMSTFKLNEDFGLLIALTIVAALAADFLLLPALLIRLDRSGAGRPMEIASE